MKTDRIKTLVIGKTQYKIQPTEKSFEVFKVFYAGTKEKLIRVDNPDIKEVAEKALRFLA